MGKNIFFSFYFDMKQFRFEVTLLPDYNIEEKQTMKIFIKIPPFEVPTKTSDTIITYNCILTQSNIPSITGLRFLSS